MEKDHIPRWQQGPRPNGYGPTWDRMTPRERRKAFLWDILIGFGFGGLIGFFAWWIS